MEAVRVCREIGQMYFESTWLSIRVSFGKKGSQIFSENWHSIILISCCAGMLDEDEVAALGKRLGLKLSDEAMAEAMAEMGANTTN